MNDTRLFPNSRDGRLRKGHAQTHSHHLRKGNRKGERERERERETERVRKSEKINKDEKAIKGVL